MAADELTTKDAKSELAPNSKDNQPYAPSVAEKSAAKAIKEGYESYLKSHKGLSVAHKLTGEGNVVVTIAGTSTAIDSAYKSITSDTHTTLVSVQPEKTIIHSAHLQLHDAGKADKEEDAKKTLTIHHVITTY